MFIELHELSKTISDHTLNGIMADDTAKTEAIKAAIQEATGYLNAKYDCTTIFNATGDERNPLLLVHCQSLAVWFLIRKSNAGVVFEKAKIYRDSAIDWFEKVAGFDGKTIAADLPIKKIDGQIRTKIRMGSNPKFFHSFDD